MKPARDNSMRLLFLCPQGHVLRKPTMPAPDFCDACHADFNWSDLQAEIPTDQCRQLFVEVMT